MIGLTTVWDLCKGAMPRVESDLRWHGSFCVGSVSCVLATLLFLTSSSCHPKVFVKEFCYFLMSCHQHCLGVNLLVQR